MGYVYAVIALLVLGGGGYGVWSYKDAIAGRERAEASAKQMKDAYEHLAKHTADLQETINDNEQIMRLRGARAEQAERESGKLKKELEDEKQRDPVLASWANAPVPEYVRMRLDPDGAPASSGVQGSDGGTGSNRATGLRRPREQ